MPFATIKKTIPCTKENLIKMVLDIERYPEFVPWCVNGKIYTKNDMKKVKKSDKKTKNTVSQKGFLNSFLSSIKQKMYGVRKRK